MNSSKNNNTPNRVPNFTSNNNIPPRINQQVVSHPNRIPQINLPPSLMASHSPSTFNSRNTSHLNNNSIPKQELKKRKTTSSTPFEVKNSSNTDIPNIKIKPIETFSDMPELLSDDDDSSTTHPVIKTEKPSYTPKEAEAIVIKCEQNVLECIQNSSDSKTQIEFYGTRFSNIIAKILLNDPSLYKNEEFMRTLVKKEMMLLQKLKPVCSTFPIKPTILRKLLELTLSETTTDIDKPSIISHIEAIVDCLKKNKEFNLDREFLDFYVTIFKDLCHSFSPLSWQIAFNFPALIQASFLLPEKIALSLLQSNPPVWFLVNLDKMLKSKEATQTQWINFLGRVSQILSHLASLDDTKNSMSFICLSFSQNLSSYKNLIANPFKEEFVTIISNLISLKLILLKKEAAKSWSWSSPTPT